MACLFSLENGLERRSSDSASPIAGAARWLMMGSRHHTFHVFYLIVNIQPILFLRETELQLFHSSQDALQYPELAA